MKITYNNWSDVPKEYRDIAVSKDYGTCEYTGRQLVVYIVEVKDA